MGKVISVSKGGKITIPLEIRKEFDINEGDQLWIEKEEGKLVIMRNQPTEFDISEEVE